MHSSTVGQISAGREKDILRRLRHGDRRGLEQLMDRYGEDLMRYLAVILGNREVAEDVFQDAWVKVMERIERFNPERPFAPWLFRVARNCAYDQLRRKKRWWSFEIDENRGDLKFLCTKCHQPLVSGSRFCPSCGTEVAQAEDTDG